MISATGLSATGSGAEFIFAEDLAATREEMRLARRGQSTRSFETRYSHKDGHTVDVTWSGVWSAPEAKHFFIGRDISERKASEAKLRHLALFDQLTGLPNRTSLQNDLSAWLEGHQNSAPSPFSIVLFDLDGFKDINDALGHSEGDKLLRAALRIV